MSDGARQFMMMVVVVIIIFIPVAYRAFLIVSHAVQSRTRDIGRTQSAPGRAWFAEALGGPRSHGEPAHSQHDDQDASVRRPRPESRGRAFPHSPRVVPGVPPNSIERDTGWEEYERGDETTPTST